jgi:hypothetical protein
MLIHPLDAMMNHRCEDHHQLILVRRAERFYSTTKIGYIASMDKYISIMAGF